MILTKSVVVRWGTNNYKSYIDKGYKFTKLNDLLEVKPCDLSKYSYQEIECICDKCKSKYTTQYVTYYKQNIKYGMDMCPKCKGSINAIKSSIRNSQYRGGVPTQYKIIFLKYIEKWQDESRKKYNYMCYITNEKTSIVHHHKPYVEILAEAFEKTKFIINPNIKKQSEIKKIYGNEKIQEVGLEVEKLHYKYGLGVCLSKEAHYLVHKLFKNYAFKNRLDIIKQKYPIEKTLNCSSYSKYFY